MVERPAAHPAAGHTLLNRVMCDFANCTNSNGLLPYSDGKYYCRTHLARVRNGLALPASSPSAVATTAQSNPAQQVKTVSNNELGSKLDDVLAKVDNLIAQNAQLQAENLELNNQLGELVTEVKQLKAAKHQQSTLINDLMCANNQRFFKNDALNQYSRHESIRIHNIPEVADNAKEDCFAEAVKIANKMGFVVNKNDFQRCHRVGKRRTTPRPIICKARWYETKKTFMLRENRNKLRVNLKDKSIKEKEQILSTNAFVTEDLSPFRGKMFRYIKNWNKSNNVFDAIGTNYGVICCKVKNSENWLRISNTDDFFKAGIPYDEEFVKEFKDDIFIIT